MSSYSRSKSLEGDTIFDIVWRTIRATLDLVWTFLPILIVVLVLSLFGHQEELARRSDLILVAPVLFTEGWLRTRRGPIAFTIRNNKALETLGFIGAMLAVLLATVVVLIEVGQITELSRAISHETLTKMQAYALIAGILYGIKVRSALIKIEEDEFWRNVNTSVLNVTPDNERKIVKFLSNIKPNETAAQALAKLDDATSLLEYGRLPDAIHELAPIIMALYETVEKGRYQEFFDIHNREMNRLSFNDAITSTTHIMNEEKKGASTSNHSASEEATQAQSTQTPIVLVSDKSNQNI